MLRGALRARSRLGKYRIVARIGEGGFASVYRARDTIEGIDVALKIPRQQLTDGNLLEELRREVRLTARLEHANILPLKNAERIGDLFVIAYPLGKETLESRIARRLSTRQAFDYVRQLVAGVAHAHAKRIIHCDIKPDNIILFADGRLRLGDFGIAKVAQQRGTLASGQGTVGYIAPEQALGRPTLRSDVFSIGLVMYRLFTGRLPTWPYAWPPPGSERLRGALHPDLIAVIRRCIEVDERKRFAHAGALQTALERLKTRALKAAAPRARRRRSRGPTAGGWRSVRKKEFLRRFRTPLEVKAHCAACGGPLSESMLHCPWCSKAQRKYAGPHRFNAACGRCNRSAKGDWRYCAYCYGGAIQEPGARHYSDRRYTAHCHACRGPLMPFMRYCPLCRAKTRQRWTLAGVPERCPRCRWPVVKEYWDHCPWCARTLATRPRDTR